MGTYDYSPFFAPVQPDGQGRGMSHVGSVLDAIMERRERAKLQKMQEEEAYRRAILNEQGEAVRANMVEGRERDKMAADADRHREDMELRRAAADRDERRLGIDAWGRAVPHIQDDRPSLAAKYLELVDPVGTARARAGSQQPQVPSLQLQAPPSIADMQPQPAPQAPAPGPTVPPVGGVADAIMDGVSADRKRREERARATLSKLVKPGDKFGEKALEDVVAALGDVPATEWEKRFTARRQFLEGQAGALERSRNARFVMSPDKRADNERADVQAFEGAYQKWEGANNVDKLTDAYDKFREMSANTDNFTRDGSTIDLRSALYQTARYITGPGVLTPQEYQNTVSKTTGAIGSALTKLQQNLDGAIDEKEFEALRKFVKNAEGAIKRRGSAAVRVFDKKFGGSYYERTAPGEVARARQALIERFGADDPKAIDDSAAAARSLLEETRK